MAVTESGLLSWGKGEKGALGLGENMTVTDMPRNVEGVGRAYGQAITSIACSTEHSAIVTNVGNIYVWGYGKYGRLGLGDEKNVFKPMQMTTMSGHRHPGHLW